MRRSRLGFFVFFRGDGPREGEGGDWMRRYGHNVVVGCASIPIVSDSLGTLWEVLGPVTF